MTATEPVADLRVCRACRQAKPLESFRLVEARYRSHTCEQCKYRQRVARTKTQTLAKLCTKCGVLKGIADCGHKPPRHRLHAHHDNYEYPLRVEWLCADCHAALHGHVC